MPIVASLNNTLGPSGRRGSQNQVFILVQTQGKATQPVLNNSMPPQAQQDFVITLRAVDVWKVSEGDLCRRMAVKTRASSLDNGKMVVLAGSLSSSEVVNRESPDDVQESRHA